VSLDPPTGLALDFDVLAAVEGSLEAIEGEQAGGVEALVEDSVGASTGLRHDSGIGLVPQPVAGEAFEHGRARRGTSAQQRLHHFDGGEAAVGEESAPCAGLVHIRAVHDFEDSYGAVTARFYDAAYATLERLGPDRDFYLRLARESGGPVLELGCGTGRVLLAVARDGIECTGVDASREMLDALQAKARGRAPQLVQARMQEFDLGDERFALIYAPFRVFQHLYTVEAQLACLARVRAHLAPGGRLAFDVFNPRLDRIWIEDVPEEQDLRFSQDGEEVVRYVATQRDRPSQLMQLTMRYERRREGRVVGNEFARFRMRWYTRFELEHLMARAGFDEVAIYGDFDRSPLGRESPSLIVVASAPC